ncbi:hypothetical protein BPMI_01336 [Candidatus Burkholderia pumila]|uniref:ABM domain-containing protein n=1 Tax=Candidatus Burkholderia pumila TaxID=1090375 RepID=A0ABR5HLG4_9BURK|nr:hypothetical protein BPMI_01336 [Candidatus Burkholderia pumila]
MAATRSHIELQPILLCQTRESWCKRGAVHIAEFELHIGDNEEPRRFIFLERWESDAALDEHGQSAHIQAFRAKAPDLIEHGEVRRATKML